MWTPEEDDILKSLVQLYGMKWITIAGFVEGKSAKQCGCRWHSCLNPVIQRTAWKPDDDANLFKLRSELGNKWSMISKQFPGRAPNNVKNRYYSLIRKDTRAVMKKGIAFQRQKPAMAMFESMLLTTHL